MNKENPEELSTIKQRILAKQKVQEEMDELRVQIRELKKQLKEGQKVDQDIEACLGYLKFSGRRWTQSKKAFTIPF